MEQNFVDAKSKLTIAIVCTCTVVRAEIAATLNKTQIAGHVEHFSSFQAILDCASLSSIDVALISGESCLEHSFEVSSRILTDLGIRWVSFKHGLDRPDSAARRMRQRSGLFSLPNDISPEALKKALRAITNSSGSAPAVLKPRKERSDIEFERFVMIGSSTGGIDALIRILKNYPEQCPPTIIVQHTGASYLPKLANLLSMNCQAPVVVAKNGMEVRSGRVILAVGSLTNTEIAQSNGQVICRLTAPKEKQRHTPSISRLFSTGAHLRGKAIGVLLTGMGSDGSLELGMMRRAGAVTIVQDETTSVVYGMPRVAWENGAAEFKLAIEDIGPKILRLAAKPKAGIRVNGG